MRSWLSIVLVGVSGLAIAACGGSGSGNPYSGGTGGNGGTGGSGGIGGNGGAVFNCSTLSVPPPDCDKPCTSDSQCEASFCNNGTCTAQCTAEEGCGAGSSCNTTRGRCVPDISTGGTGGTGGTGNTNGCQSVTITPTRSIPNVMFLVDQSGSMVESFSGGQDRWEAAHSAITDIVSDLESIVRFGLTTYTSRNGDQNPPCPRLPTQVGFALLNAANINSSYPSMYPPNSPEDTPTGASIDALVTIIEGAPPPADGPTIVVLATDGLPDSCEHPDPNPGSPEEADALNKAVDAARRAYDEHEIQTFILSVGPEVTDVHLQEMANVGVGVPRSTTGPAAATFWKATNSVQLAAAFSAIIGASISCDIRMDKRFDDVVKACDEGDVRLNGTPLSCPSEWRVKPGVDDVIELVGSACQAFKSGSSTFTAVFPCGAIVVE